MSDAPTVFLVPTQSTAIRLDAFLAQHVSSRSEAQRLIDAGAVLVNGQVRQKRLLLHGGETVTVSSMEVDPAATAQPPVDYTVRFEDEYILVVDKPAGVVVHPARGFRSTTLIEALGAKAAGGPDPERPGVIHRLDRNTSGLLIVTRSEPAYKSFKRMLERREIKREYLALIDGHPPARRGTIDAPIGRDRRNRTRMSIDSERTRVAVTHFAVEELLQRAALLRIELETGRTHQIRAHFASIGHPLLGDRDYGGPILYGLSRQFLHATRLTFQHPFTEETIVIDSPLPADLKRALEQARKA